MKLILVRHGRTNGNETLTIEGPDAQLSKMGKSQARKLGLRLKNEEIDVIFSSPYLRAKETALEIVKYHPSLEINYLDELRERDVDNYYGKKYEEVNWSDVPKDMENYESLVIRAKKVIEKIYSEYSDRCVLLVSHGGIIKSIIKIIENIDGDPEAKFNLDNTGVSIFEIKGSGNGITSFINCTDHLSSN